MRQRRIGLSAARYPQHPVGKSWRWSGLNSGVTLYA
jgi:hypothetical protein